MPSVWDSSPVLSPVGSIGIQATGRTDGDNSFTGEKLLPVPPPMIVIGEHLLFTIQRLTFSSLETERLRPGRI